MINISRHIEVLLLENDCVIVPGFGGFVAHYVPAKWSQEENRFLAPCRTIGFNPLLKINDGVLVQSYMEVYSTDFSDAGKRIDKEVETLTQVLQREGKVELPNIGELYYSIDLSYTFKPYNDKIVSPLLYGLDSFDISELEELKKKTLNTELALPSTPFSKKHYEIRINRSWLHNAVAAVIAIVLFFSFSTPIENTQIEKINYARLMPTDLFEKLEYKSLLTTSVGINEAVKETVAEDPIPSEKEEAEDIKPVEVVETVTAKPAVSEEVKVKNQRTYHIIVASVVKEKDGEDILEKLHAKGYSNAQLVKGDGRIRISLVSYSNRSEANGELLNWRNNDEFKNAWLLSVKP